MPFNLQSQDVPMTTLLPDVDRMSRSVQDYLKTIFSLTRSGRPVTTLQLAEALRIAPASVTNMLQKLDETRPRLVEYQKHRGVVLSNEGEQAALKIIRRHRLIELFLYEIMGYSWEKVHEEAEELEHVISPYFEERLADLLKNPLIDPHGEPIPDHTLHVAEDLTTVPLSSLQPGEGGVVQRVSGQQPGLFAYLARIGLQPGSTVQVLERNPLDGTLRVSIAGSPESSSFGSAVSQSVWIKT